MRLSRSLRVKLLFLISVAFLLPVALGQELKEQVEVQLVQVDVVATNSKGQLITDLTADDFVLKEDGKVQKISHFYNSANEESRYPLAISFLVDTSYSMHERVQGMTRIDIAVQAAEMVMDELKPDDQIELIDFNNEPKEIVPFTSDVNSAYEKFKTLDFQKANTAMRDAVVMALDKIRDRSGRKIVVIFSDGMDTCSKALEDDAFNAVKKSDATIVSFYSEFAALNFPEAGMGMGENSGPMSHIKIRIGEDALREYADISGGQFFSFRKEPELLAAMDGFRALIKSQYTLAYTPAIPKKGGWKKIKVECKRKDVKLRYREGYWAG
jgi:Ca-activated chloride channel family protein